MEGQGQAGQIKENRMNVQLSQRAIEQLATAPLPVQKAFIKQINFLARNLGHLSLHAKKYDEAEDLWQARINQDWRFYFTIAGDAYRVENLIPHPK
jgi:plasmid maintenance system killer protein